MRIVLPVFHFFFFLFVMSYRLAQWQAQPQLAICSGVHSVRARVPVPQWSQDFWSGYGSKFWEWVTPYRWRVVLFTICFLLWVCIETHDVDTDVVTVLKGLVFIWCGGYTIVGVA
jgi:hypothetical protein